MTNIIYLNKYKKFLIKPPEKRKKELTPLTDEYLECFEEVEKDLTNRFNKEVHK